jgi:hypothetical protein
LSINSLFLPARAPEIIDAERIIPEVKAMIMKPPVRYPEALNPRSTQSRLSSQRYRRSAGPFPALARKAGGARWHCLRFSRGSKLNSLKKKITTDRYTYEVMDFCTYEPA